MAMTWTDIADGTIASGQGLKTGVLMIALRDNDEANSSKPIYCLIDTGGSKGTTYGGTADQTFYVFLPEDCKVLRFVFALWTASGTVTAKVQVEKITAPAGTTSVETTSTATAKGTPGGSADKTATLTGLNNVSGDDLRGTSVKVSVWLKHSVGSVQCDIENTNWSPSRASLS